MPYAARSTARTALFPALLLAGIAVVPCSTAGRAWAAADPTKSLAGFVFVNPADGKAELRAEPDPEAKVVATAPNGARLVFRSVAVGVDNKNSWYRVEPPGGTPGWLAIAEASDKRPTTPPAARPIKLLESGIEKGSIAASPTAAARGLDDKSKRYAQESDLGDAADEFITLEAFVEKLYSDPHGKNGTYPESGEAVKPRNAARKAKAIQFRRGIK